MFKRRSAHGIFSAPQILTISKPTNPVKLSGMSSLEEARPIGADSVIPDPASVDQNGGSGNGTAEGPLDGEPMQTRAYEGASTPDPPRTPSPVKSVDLHPLRSHPVVSRSGAESAAPPPDFSRYIIDIHVPTRTSSNGKVPPNSKRRFLRSSSTPTRSMRPHPIPTTPRPHSRPSSSADSLLSYETETTAPSVTTQTLVPLQQKSPPADIDRLSPLLEDDPHSFDLVSPEGSDVPSGEFPLETRADELFSRAHLEAIFQYPSSLLRFTSFLSHARPNSVPVLIYYLDALKSIRAINYANAVAEALEPLDGLDFTQHPPRPTVNAVLEEKARQAFDVLVREDLPAFITHVFIQVVSVNIQKRITGKLAPPLRETSEGLAEVFCISDPSRADNPIIFASDEFHRTTQYGVSFAIGRNCRFLQGPKTDLNSVTRLRHAVAEGRETSELILNYRRDGSPFMNLLMLAPLLDSRGQLRYYLGAQVDVSGLVKDGTDLEAFRRMLEEREGKTQKQNHKDELQELSRMFNNAELDIVRRFGGSMHREIITDDAEGSTHHRPRVLIRDQTNSEFDNSHPSAKLDTRISGVYTHYLLVRPAPSLRILFTSPSLRVPGILQSRFLDRIGGSTRVRNSLAEALTDGTRGVTAKIRWLSVAASSLDDNRAEEGRRRWIHCTPLLGANGAVGVWMVVLVDDDMSKSPAPMKRFRPAPPVANEIHVPKRHGSPSVDPGGANVEDEFDKRPNRYSMPLSRSSAAASIRSRPLSVMSEQRAPRAGSPSGEPSIHSFALS